MRPVDRFKAIGVRPGFVASELGITAGAVSQWDRVPSERVIEVERITGISRSVLRPDIYPEPMKTVEAAE